jgi:hypothetical protein
VASNGAASWGGSAKRGRPRREPPATAMTTCNCHEGMAADVQSIGCSVWPIVSSACLQMDLRRPKRGAAPRHRRSAGDIIPPTTQSLQATPKARRQLVRKLRDSKPVVLQMNDVQRQVICDTRGRHRRVGIESADAADGEAGLVCSGFRLMAGCVQSGGVCLAPYWCSPNRISGRSAA